MTVTKDIKNAVFAGDSVYDFMQGTLELWETDPYSSQLRPLLRFVDGDHVDSLHASENLTWKQRCCLLFWREKLAWLTRRRS